MIRVYKLKNSPYINFAFTFESNEYLVAQIAALEEKKKIKELTLRTLECPQQSLKEKWEEGREKSERIFNTLREILPGKRYRPFLLQVSDSFKDLH